MSIILIYNIITSFSEHTDIVSAKDSPYTMSTNSDEVPVSVVDMDVPVTAIDEVLEYEHDIIQHEGKSLTRTESAGSKGKKNNQHISMYPLQLKVIYVCFSSIRLTIFLALSPHRSTL